MAITIDGTTGITTPGLVNTGTESVVNITSTGNLNFGGTSQRITGDFTNTTTTPVAFQSSTTNGATQLVVIPNGTSTNAGINFYSNSADITNSSRGLIRIDTAGPDFKIDSTRTGTGTYLPITFYTSGSEKLRLDTSGNLLVGTTSASVPSTTGFVSSANTFGFKNRIINGGMVINQRNAGASSTGNGYTVDRFAYFGAAASKGTWQQNAGSVTPPTGFKNYLGFTSSSAYSVGAAEQFNFYQPIEGFNVSDLGWGATGAATVTLSFWVRSSLTGTFGGAIYNSAVNRSYPFSYTISVANTWEQKTITIAGDMSGTWLTTNGIGLYVNFSLGAGSTVSGTAGAWTTGRYDSVTGATSVVGTNGATFYITGVQLEKGSVATSFDQRAYSQELAMCQRYLPALTNTVSGTYAISNAGGIVTTTTARITIPFQVAARVPPTGLTTTAASGFYLYNGSQMNQSPTALALALSGIYQSEITATFPAINTLGIGQFTCFWFQTLGAQLLFTGCEL